MRAIVITRFGGPEVLRLEEIAAPELRERCIRVHVHATAVNRADLLQRRGSYPAPAGALANVPGLEYAGVVDALGAQVTRWRVGDRVMGIVAGGGYAEFVVIHEDEALPVPADLSLQEAAAIPEAFLTADDALFTTMQLAAEQTLLIHAVASGVGTAAAQLARAVGARVIGTSRSAEKLQHVQQYGLSDSIDASAEDFIDAVLRLTGGHGVNGVLDLVGGSYMSRNVHCCAPRGRIVLVGLTAGSRAELDLTRLMRKRLTVTGTVMRTRSVEEKIAVAQAFAERSLRLFGTGELRPVIDRILPIERAGEAHELLEANATVGKVVLAWNREPVNR